MATCQDQGGGRRRAREPVFDVPPRIGGSIERRLAGRATAHWHDARGNRPMPLAGAYDVEAGVDAAAIATTSIVIELTDRETVTSVGAAVGAAFGIAPGPLVAGDPAGLAQCLRDALATVAATPAPVPFEGVFAPPGSGEATLLTRGVVLPLAGADGRLTAAHVVVTWKETLSADAATRLRRELALAFGGRAIAADRRDFGAPTGKLPH